MPSRRLPWALDGPEHGKLIRQEGHRRAALEGRHGVRNRYSEKADGQVVGQGPGGGGQGVAEQVPGHARAEASGFAVAARPSGSSR